MSDGDGGAGVLMIGCVPAFLHASDTRSLRVVRARVPCTSGVKDFAKELIVLMRLRHEHIVTFFGIYQHFDVEKGGTTLSDRCDRSDSAVPCLLPAAIRGVFFCLSSRRMSSRRRGVGVVVVGVVGVLVVIVVVVGVVGVVVVVGGGGEGGGRGGGAVVVPVVSGGGGGGGCRGGE
jgi:hypothetical protein